MFGSSNLLILSSKNQDISLYRKYKLRGKNTNHSLLEINEFEFSSPEFDPVRKISAWEDNWEEDFDNNNK